MKTAASLAARLCWLGLILCMTLLHPWVRADSIVHQGPVLDIQVQRGEERLPIFLVPRLQQGDQLLVRPDPSSMAKGDWILMLGLIAPAGNRVQTQAIDVSKLDGFARLDIVSDEHAPVIVLAPQLRNLFGLYTSFRESSTLLDEVIQSDPQRFYDLQRLDEVNQAISALAQGLDQLLLHRNPAEGIAAARAMAQKFGVSQVDPECFRNNTVNTQCVAVNIVANKDFVLPSSSELGMLAGSKGMADLTGFLADKVKVFSDAGDFLSNKFRDQYDFAATFGRRWRDTGSTQLFSLTRFRKGNIKTAYVYVPAWFKGRTPALSAQGNAPICLSQGRFEVKASDRMPVLNHWHSWQMRFTDPATGTPLGQATEVSFLSERGTFRFAGAPSAAPGPWVEATLQGQFGFERVSLPPVQLAVPPTDARRLLAETRPLVSGEQSQWQLRGPEAACVQALTLSRDGTVLARSQPGAADRLTVDLTGVAPGPVELRVDLLGSASQTVPLRVLPPRALVRSVEHTDLEEHLIVTGQRLDRLARAQLGNMLCAPVRIDKDADGMDRLQMACDGDVRHNAALPATVVLHHQQEEPEPVQTPLRKNASPPRVRLAASPNALLVRPSAKARRWGLDNSAQLLTDDSGLNLLLQTSEGYTLTRGSYSLQLRFADDAATARNPISVPLMLDLNHQELRTRQAVQFKGMPLPTVVNPLEYRVVQDASGLAGAWTPLQRAVLMLPQLGELTCATTPGHWWLPGSQLNLVDAVGWTEQSMGTAQLQPCPDGLCLLLPQSGATDRLSVRLHWVRESVFSVDTGRGPGCPAP